MRDPAEKITIAGVTVELAQRGQGRPLLFLHPFDDVDPDSPFLKDLATDHKVYIPTHPGFGGSELPRNISTVDDLAYFYLDLLDTLDLKDVLVVGVSFGGWIAAEMAVKSTARMRGLILADTVGIKIGPATKRDIVDIFAVTAPGLQEMLYVDAKRYGHKFTELDEDVLLRIARNRESLLMYGWAPTLYNPKLKQRLHRIKIPVAVLWGAEDRIVPPDYGRAFTAEIPGATFGVIEGSGHYPHIEKPADFARAVRQIR